MNAPPLIHAAVTMTLAQCKRTAQLCSVRVAPRTIRSIENGRVLLAIIHSARSAADAGAAAAFIERWRRTCTGASLVGDDWRNGVSDR